MRSILRTSQYHTQWKPISKKTLVENSIEDEIIKIFQGFSNEEISAVLDYFSKLFKRRYLSEMKRRKKDGNKMQLTMFD